MKDLISGNLEMQMRRSKVDQTVEGIFINVSNISKGTAFLYQVVVYMIEWKRFIRYKTLMNKGSGFRNIG